MCDYLDATVNGLGMRDADCFFFWVRHERSGVINDMWGINGPVGPDTEIQRFNFNSGSLVGSYRENPGLAGGESSVSLLPRFFTFVMGYTEA